MRRANAHPAMRANDVPVLAVTALTTLFLTFGCAPATFVVKQPTGAAGIATATQFQFDPSGGVSQVTIQLPPARRAPGFAVRGCGPPGSGTPGKTSPDDKLHPLLRRWLIDSTGTTRAELMIAYRDPLTLPPFPEPRMEEPRSSPTNRAAFARVDSLIGAIRAQREHTYKDETDYLGKLGAVRVREKYWITQAILVDMPLSEVRSLAQRPDVVAITPDHSGEPPPSCTLPGQPARDDTPQSARDAMHVDALTFSGLDSGWFCLLDTGVDSTHIVFINPADPTRLHPRLGLLGDCVNGDLQCMGVPGIVSGADIDPNGHGTSTAAIVIGYAQPNNCERGVIVGRMDCLKVYSTTLCPAGCSGVCLVHSAVLKAFQMARYRLNTVTIAEMQAWGPPDGDISNAANQVFNTGGVVIAAQGNCPCTICSPSAPLTCPDDGQVKAPANAHYVIGAGGWDIKDPAHAPISMSCGPTVDGRVKPDVLAPTATYVAGDHSNTDLHPYIDTSGATPYAAGAAGLIQHFLSASPTPSDHEPGMTYAWLIASGRDTWKRRADGTPQTTFAANRGAGPIELQDFNRAWIGKVSIANGAVQTVPIDLTGTTANRLEAALWWADPHQSGIFPLFGHCRIDLELSRSGTSLVAESREASSVFQRATATIGAADRTMWNLKMTGSAYPSWASSQDVYYTVFARP